MSTVNIGGVDFVRIDDIREVIIDTKGKLNGNWAWVTQQLVQISESSGDLFGAVWAHSEKTKQPMTDWSFSSTLILTPTNLLLADKGLYKQPRTVKISLSIDLIQIESIEVMKNGILCIRHGGKRTYLQVYISEDRIPELIGKLISLRDFHQIDSFNSAISKVMPHPDGDNASVSLEPIMIDVTNVPSDAGFLALHVGGAGYGLREGELHRVLLAPDKESLILVDLPAGTALRVPAARLISLDYEGGEFQKGGNLVGGGFGIIGAAIGIAGAAAINKVTRKSVTQTVCRITTDDGEITLYTDEVAPHEIDQMLAEFRLASRKSRSQELSPPAESKGSSDLATQIRELSALHADGILSDEEFAKAKERVLGSQS